MKKLIHGIVEFRKNLAEGQKTLFANLAKGQKPDALLIACSDSRVVPNLFASTNPGDLFVYRNIGNLVPPASPSPEDTSSSAALEFAIFSLNVSDIIICGHSECGAMEALAAEQELSCCPHLTAWLKNGATSLERCKKGLVLDDSLSKQNQLSQVNVLQQIEHLLSYPFVRERVEKKALRLHGWWFEIAKAEVYCYEPTLNRYVLIDEDEAKLILERMQ